MKDNVFIKSTAQSNACIGSVMTGKGRTSQSKYFTRLISILLLVLGVGSNAWGATETYTFTSKSWAATKSGGAAANWTSGKDGNELTLGRGIQVTTGSSGANGTSPVSFENVSQVVVTYSTNASKGAGSIAVKIGSNTASSQSVTKSGGTTDRTLTYNFSPNQTGNVNVAVTCTTNSIYVKSVAITYAPTATYTVTLKDEDLGTLNTLTQASAGTSVTLPSRDDVGIWSFEGWSIMDAGTVESSSYDGVIIPAGSYVPTSNVTLYPVYSRYSADGGVTETLFQTLTYHFSDHISGSYNTNYSSYTLLGQDAYIYSDAFDLSTLSKVVVYGGTYGGSSYNSLTIGDGTNVWKNVTVSGSSQTGKNEYIDGDALTGTKPLRIISLVGNASTTGIRVSSVEIYVATPCAATVYIRKPTISVLEEPTLAWNGSAPGNKLIGDTYTRTATTNSDGAVTYSSDPTSVAMVNATTGEVTAVGTGTATITATVAETATYSAKSITYDVTVIKPDIATISSITPSTTSMLIGDNGTTTAVATIYEDASDKYDQTFESTNTSVVTVVDSSTGAYTAVGVGDATIKVTYAPKSAYANRYKTVTMTSTTISVTKPNVATINTLTPTYIEEDDEGNFTLGADYYTGLTLSDYTVSYSIPSSDESKLSVTSSGYYTAHSQGTATVTVTITPVNTNRYATASQSFTVTVGGPAADGDYIKVTSEPADWTGTYLIVYEAGSKAFNGGLATLDATENSIDVTITGTKIEASATNDAASFNISSDDDSGWAILSRSGQYIGQTANDNGLRTSSELISNGLSLSGTDAVISCGTTTLRYNSAVDQQRFRYYKPGQQPVALYKRKVALKNATTAEFVTSSKKLTVGQEWTNTLTTNNTTGEWTFTSSNPAVASVDSETGEVTANALGGPVTITVNIAETATHLAGSASYTVYVLASSTRYYMAVTSTEEIDAGIAAGKKFLIATPHTGTYYAMGAISGSVGATTEVPTENDGGILYLTVDADLEDDVNEFTLTKSSDVYTFHQSLEDKYLSYSGASNNIYTSDTGDATAQQFSLTRFGDAWKIESQETPGRYLQYNSGSPRYCCYTGTQTNPMIFMEGKAVATIGNDFSPTEVIVNENGTLTVTITPASGLSSNDYSVNWTASNTKLTINNASTGAVTAGASTGSVDVTIMVSPVDATIYSPIVKTFTVDVVDLYVPGESNYVLVESAPEDWSGTYLIVYNNQYALNSHYGNKNTDTYATYADISSYYNNKKIASNSTTDAYQITIEKTANGYSLYDEGTNDGAFLGYNSTKNHLRWDGTYLDSRDEWTLGVNSIVSVYNSERGIRWNNTSEQERFATYVKTNQQPVQLFKLVTKPTQYNFKVYDGSSNYTIENVTDAAPTLTGNQVAVISGLSGDQVDAMPDDIKNAENVVVNGATSSLSVSDYTMDGETKVYHPFYAPVDFTAASVSYSRSNTAGWNSVCLPFSIPFAKVEELFGTDAEVYQLTGLNPSRELVFTKLNSDTVPAGKPVLVYSVPQPNSEDNVWDATMSSINIKGGEADSTYVDNANGRVVLFGTYSEIVPGTVYGSTLYKLKADGTSFGTMSASAKVFPFRMYIKYTPPSASSAPARLGVKIRIVDSTAGDLNSDKFATIADLTTLVNMVNGQTEPTDAGDINGDGEVNQADVDALLKILTRK